MTDELVKYMRFMRNFILTKGFNQDFLNKKDQNPSFYYMQALNQVITLNAKEKKVSLEESWEDLQKLFSSVNTKTFEEDLRTELS